MKPKRYDVIVVNHPVDHEHELIHVPNKDDGPYLLYSEVLPVVVGAIEALNNKGHYDDCDYLRMGFECNCGLKRKALAGLETLKGEDA